jgi:hypothetical protein
MPAARHASRSEGRALAVIPMIGVGRRPADCSSVRIARADSKPSISGMWQSIRMRSKRAERQHSTPMIPLSAIVDSHECLSRIACA